MSRPTEYAVCDRRILKAFYTQYVAVLLIILVFSVGAFQRATLTSPPLAPRVPNAESIGSLNVFPDFDSLGALVGESAELKAIASLVREHDIRAIVTLSASIRDDNPELSEIERDLARLDALRGYFLSQGLSDAAFQFVLGAASAQEGEVTVQFEEHHHDNLPL